MSTASLPLDGITVVAVEQAVAAPLATRQLTDLGARVIKIERIGEGDFARNYDTAVLGQASHFVWINRGKQSLALDLKDERGLAVARELIARADVFVHNTAPGALPRLGLDPHALHRRYPRLVLGCISGYGTAGPLRDRKAYDMLIQAESGLVSVTGTPEVATKTGVPSADIAAGLYTAQGVLAALFRRERTGRGALIDVSMFDATAEWLGHPLYMQLYAGTQVPRLGLGHAAIAPYDSYPTADGDILIGIQNDRGWRALVTSVFGLPELADHPDFATNTARVAHRKACDATVAAQTRRFLTADLDRRLAEAGVPAARVNDLAGLAAHPQLSERDRWRRIDTPAGPIRALLPPATFTDVEAAMGPIPQLGAHTRELLTEIGYASKTVDALIAAGVAAEA
ncbi:CoA transferase [Nocardia neocaledoniensis NBRC 108232]|uniref:Formyl-CoA transferase n=1 Tax=Nocardia neocaledoniensis TaxID=236511 RepID=A0A317N250_9NOCA|nr:CaiB/BaiF CoA-transferase family protein [Nocardia neocaledoniensis]PWV67579.1 formyl-CoA transferase [Nocardia neocaledoniensis]GEM31277.1 CoA transferase [Nocardia neocaledoniensis NBRC 108232]